MTPQQDSNQGRNAQAIIENPAFLEAMALLKSSVVTQWKESSIRDHEGQTLLLQMARLADTFEGLLIGIVERGKMAQRKIEKIEIDELRDENKARNMLRRVM